MDVDQEQRQLHRQCQAVHHHNHQIYDPQSSATPEKSGTGSTGTIPKKAIPSSNADEDQENNAGALGTATNAGATRRRKRRSLFGTAKLSPASKAAKQQRKSTATAGLLARGENGRRACLTEILWEDVQKAKELLGFRQKSSTNAAAASSVTPGQSQQGPQSLASSSVGEPSLQQHPLIARMMTDSAKSASGTGAASASATASSTGRGCDCDCQPRFAPIALTETEEDLDWRWPDWRSTAGNGADADATAAAAAATEMRSGASASSTLPRRRSHRHRRASSDLADASSIVESSAAAPYRQLKPPTPPLPQPPSSADPDCGSCSSDYSFQSHLLSSQFNQPMPPSSARSLSLHKQQQQQQQQSSAEHQRRVARFWELKRLLADLVERKAEKLRQLSALEAKEKSLSSEFNYYQRDTCSDRSTDSLPRQQQQQQQQHQSHAQGDAQLCFPTQYLVAVEEESVQSELVQLQEEAAVQRALVEANARLLRECQTDRAARQLNRKRTQEYQRSQEKLRSLNQRIAEIRARDSAEEAAAVAAASAAATASCSNSSFASSLNNNNNDDAVMTEVSADADRAAEPESPIIMITDDRTDCAGSLRQHQQRQLEQQQFADRRMHSFRVFAKPQPPSGRAQNASALASTVSVDSGFQEISCCTSSTTSLELASMTGLQRNIGQQLVAMATVSASRAAVDDASVDPHKAASEAMDADADF